MITEPELFSNIWYLALFISSFYVILLLFRRPKSPVKRQKTEKDIKKKTIIRNDGYEKAYTFQWKIENLNYCWLKKKKRIKSPIFTTEALNDTKWSIELCGKEKENENSIIVSLFREKDRFGPEFIEVKYQLSFLKKDGSILKNRDIGEDDFKRNQIGIWSVDEKWNNICDTEKNPFVLEDALTVLCKIWKKDEKPIVSELLSSRTIFKEHFRSFIWKIDEFNFLQADNILVKNELKDGLINFELILNDESLTVKSLFIDVHPSDDFINFVSFKASIIDSEGNKINCGNYKYVDANVEEDISFPLSFTENMLTEDRSLYFQNDVLNLDCEYILSTATALSECANCGTLSADFKTKNEIVEGKEMSQMTLDLADDLKSIHSNAFLSDIELRTSTQIFPAHKVILSARSTVFRRMFSNDVKEKRTGHVEITELDDESVNRMLKYIYTDSLGYLQMESASKLYTAADKYGILSLKNKCSSFLKENLQPISVFGVLVLADEHQDNDLKGAVQGYIMQHDKDIFDTLEWKHFMATNLKLAADVMYKTVSQNPPVPSLKM